MKHEQQYKLWKAGRLVKEAGDNLSTLLDITDGEVKESVSLAFRGCFDARHKIQIAIDYLHAEGALDVSTGELIMEDNFIQETPEVKLVTIKDIAIQLGVVDTCIRDLLRNGAVKARGVKLQGRYFHPEAVEEFRQAIADMERGPYSSSKP